MAEPAPREIKLKLASLSSILLNLIITISYTNTSLNKLNFMNRRSQKRTIQTPEVTRLAHGMSRIEQTLQYEESLCANQNCLCEVCRSKKGIKRPKMKTYFLQGSQESDKWLMKILSGLSNRDGPTMQLYIHDTSFVQGDTLKVFYTDTKDNRLKKMQGATPTKSIFATMLKLKKLYKQMLQQKFQRKLLSEINPEFIHEKYMEQIIPTHFTDDEDSGRLQINKTRFMKYVLHKDEKFLIQSIQQHKLNENQPFCSIRYRDGNMQLLSKRQFQTLTLLKIPTDISYVQSYIKQKQQTKAHYTSCYSFMSNQNKMNLFNRAQKQILVLIGGLGKYSEAYQDLQVFEDSAIELMRTNVQQYIDYTTYRIVHYLAMVSRIYVKHIKINWVLNDIDMVYFQNVFEFQTTELCLRTLKYRVPPKEDNLVFYKDSQNFIHLYKQVQLLRENRRKAIRTKILQQRKKQMQQQQQQQTQLKNSNNPSTIDLQKTVRTSTLNKNRIKLSSVSKTISTHGNNSILKQQNSRDILDRYYKSKQMVKLSQMERKKKRRNFSVVDKYVF